MTQFNFRFVELGTCRQLCERRGDHPIAARDVVFTAIDGKMQKWIVTGLSHLLYGDGVQDLTVVVREMGADDLPREKVVSGVMRFFKKENSK